MTADHWYIVKQPDGQCAIVNAPSDTPPTADQEPQPEMWGPFESQGEAIARRVGLIRAGKCNPA